MWQLNFGLASQDYETLDCRFDLPSMLPLIVWFSVFNSVLIIWWIADLQGLEVLAQGRLGGAEVAGGDLEEEELDSGVQEEGELCQTWAVGDLPPLVIPGQLILE